MSNADQLRNIHDAASKGDLKAVKDLIETQHVDVNIRNPGSGEIPLFKAAQGGHGEVIKYLIGRGANVSHLDKYGYNVLLWALDNHKAGLELIQYLVDHGADLNCEDKDEGYTPLHWAAYHCDLETVQYLVNAGAQINASAKNGATPMVKAAENSCFPIVDYFINEKHMSMDIYKAAELGLTSLVQYFSENKNIPYNEPNDQGWTLLHKAAYGGRLDTIKYLMEQKNVNVNARNQRRIPDSPLHAAVEKGHLEVAKYLIEHGADFNVRDLNGRTPLYWAADNGFLKIVKYLVEEKKAYIHTKDNYGNSILHAAGWNGSLDVVKYLLDEKNMDVNYQDHDGLTVLIESIQRGNMQVFWYLFLDRSADFELKEKGGNTVLHYAARQGYLNVVKALVEKGADFNIRNRDGRTPLYFAADGTETTGGHLSVVKYLVDDKKADCFQRDNYGNTLLHAAEWFGSLNVVKYLIEEKGLDVNAKDNDGNTPLAETLSRGKHEVSKYLESKGAKKSRRRRYVDSGDQFPLEPYATNSAKQQTSLINSCGKYLTSVISAAFFNEVPTNVHVIGSLTNMGVDGFLLLCNLGVTFISRSRSKNIRNRTDMVMSREELIAEKINENVIMAANKLSSVFDHENF